ncbi:Rv0361 family membrane protein [Williamsia sp. SKLECPSW1]
MATSNDTTAQPAPDPDDPGLRAAWPFVVAVVIVVLVIGGVVASQLLRPAEDRLPDNAAVQAAVNDFYTAKNAVNYTAFRDATCSRVVDGGSFPTATAFRSAAQASRDAHGKVIVTTIADIAVSGTSATASMTWRYEKNPALTTQSVPLVKDADTWKVCGLSAP